MADYVYLDLLPVDIEIQLSAEYDDHALNENVFDVTVSMVATSDETEFLDNVVFDIDVNLSLWFIKQYAANPVIWRARTGTTDFTIYESERNLPLGAGKTYTENFGWVYALKRLGKFMIAYGQNSIFGQMHVEGAKWGRKTLHPIGIKSIGAVCVDNEFNPTKHWCIDRSHRLLILTGDGISETLDYSNWFSLLGENTRMFYDEYYRVIRIADGNYGFTLSASGLGWGPATISGLGFRNGEYWVVTPDKSINVPPLSFSTDTFDLGSRRTKYIHRVDFGSDFIVNVSLDYRWNPTQSWSRTPWVSTDFNGSAFIQCAGVEFRLNGRLLSYSPGIIDYANIKVRYDEIAEALV